MHHGLFSTVCIEGELACYRAPLGVPGFVRWVLGYFASELCDDPNNHLSDIVPIAMHRTNALEGEMTIRSQGQHGLAKGLGYVTRREARRREGGRDLASAVLMKRCPLRSKPAKSYGIVRSARVTFA